MPTDGRLTQLAGQALLTGEPDARISQLAGQALVLYLPAAVMTSLAGQVLVHKCQADLGILPGMLTHIDASPMTLCTLWKVTATDGDIVRYCNHTRDLTYQSELYKAAPIQPSNFQSSATLAPDNQEIVSPVTPDGFTEFDLLGGKWDFSKVEIVVVNYLNMSQGHARRIVGRIGEISLQNQRFTAEFRGLVQLLDQEIGDLYSPTCRATLGDSACGVDLGPFTHTATVTAVQQEQSIFQVDVVQADGYFKYGKATFTSGNNDGLSVEIKDNAGARITLMLPIRSPIEVGDDVTLIRGCDKTRATCRDVFGNVIRMRAEPDAPGRDRVLRFPRPPTPEPPEE
jgi:uncharacterized phage protein (TIGR02218 family)